MKFIIPIIVGAVIGYITNWLAIKMLFRPHYKKEIFGVHVPFTPGLIPKEKDRIAKSIGNTIGVYLLSSEVFTEVLTGDKVRKQLHTWIKDNIIKLSNNDKTILDLLNDLLGKNCDTALKAIENKVTCFICSQISSENYINKLVSFIEDKVYNKYKDEFQLIIRDKIELLINKLSTSKEAKNGFETIIKSKIKELEADSRTLDKAVPDELIDIINVYIKSHKKEIANALKQVLENPFIAIKLKAAISEIVTQNTSKIITVFMSPENIAKKVISALESYFDDSENYDSIVSVISALEDRLLKTKVADIFKGISVENKNQVSLELSNSINNYISNKDIQSKMTDINNNMILSEQNIKEGFMNFLRSKLECLVSASSLKENVFVIVHKTVEIFINSTVSSVIGKVDDNTISNIAAVFEDIYSSFVKNKFPQVIEALDISRIVENKINSFDVALVEDIIIEIADKELKAITWLGALLGGIMGVISPLLQLIV